MRYRELYDKFGQQGLFSLNEARAVEPDFYRPRLNEWIKKGYIRKFIRNYYVFSSVSADERFIFSAANRVYAPSYISLQSALAFYGIIPDKPFSVTGLSTRKTKSFSTPFGRLIYRKVAAKHFWGYTIEGEPSTAFMIARPAKALLDLMYLETRLNSAEAIKGLRPDMKRLMEPGLRKELFSGAEKYGNSRVLRVIKEVFK